MSQPTRNPWQSLERDGPKRLRIGDRTMVACVFCKEKKQKCDGQIPACGSCQRLGRSCLVEDPISKRQTPRNYLQSLEERVAMLEGMLQQARPDVASDHFSPDVLETGLSHTGNVDDLRLQNTDFMNFSESRNAYDSSDEQNELSSKVGLLALNSPGTEPHYFGSSSAFAFSRVVNSSLRHLRDKGEGAPTSTARDLYSHVATPCPLPCPEVGKMLSQAYFEHIHIQYPFLHEATFRIWEESVMGGYVDSNENPAVYYFVNMVYAVGALVLPQITGCSAEGLYASAQYYIDNVTRMDGLESIQAILCYSMYSLRSSIGVSVWSLSGLALRQCIELGYHRSARKFSSNLDPLRLELRKRVFWCCYGIERAASITLGRPFVIQDQEIDAEFPLDINDSLVSADGISGNPRASVNEPSTTMSAAIHTFRLRQIWSQIHMTLYSSIREPHNFSHSPQIECLKKELTTWRDTVPPQLVFTSAILSIFDSGDWFKLAYNHSILLLYRGHLTTHQAPLDPQSAIIFIECAEAAQEICVSYRRLHIGQPVSYTWGALHILFLAGLTYLHCLWTSAGVRDIIGHSQMSRTCRACTMVLVVMAERWEQAAPYRDIFEALAEKTIDMILDTEKQRWLGNVQQMNGPAQSKVPNDMGRWISNIADGGMSDGIESLLSGLVGDVTGQSFMQGEPFWEGS